MGARSAASGAHRLTQVNVSAGQMNFLGDAANEPSIAISPLAPNRMVIGWRQFDTVQSNFRQAGYAVSRDGGRTWSERRVLDEGVFRSDPVLRATSEGHFLYNSLSTPGGVFQGYFFRSVDGGSNWGDPYAALGGDKIWFTVDRTNGPGRDFVYQAWNTAANSYAPATFARSTDAGQTWDSPRVIPESPIFGTLAVGPDGELYVCGLGSLTNSIVVIKSTTAQFAFQLPTFSQVVTVNLNGLPQIGGVVNPSGLLGQVWVDVDRSAGPRRGWVYLLCSVDPPGPDPLDLMFARSTDGGLTWSPPVRINDDAGNTSAYQWFGTMSVGPTGRIDVIWNDTREDPTGHTSRLCYSDSNDGGSTWAATVPLTGAFDSRVGWPAQAKLGDYYDMHSDLLGATVACAATFNGEQDVYCVRIGADDCNSNGTADADEIATGRSRDCNANGAPDECDIAAGAVLDTNGNGIPNPCETPVCLADTNRDGRVTFADVTAVLASFGGPAGVPGRVGDASGDGLINLGDIEAVFLRWGGACP